jgi:hypothetical protein
MCLPLTNISFSSEIWKYKRVQTLNGARTPSVPLLSAQIQIKKRVNVQNVQLKYAINAIEKLILDRAVMEPLESKYKTGKMLRIFKSVRNVKVWYKK